MNFERHSLSASPITTQRELEKICCRLQSNSTKQKVDALLDAFEYGQAGIELIIQALNDHIREVRQSAFLLLSDCHEDIARQGIWNYLPFRKIQCLHTLTNFDFNSNYSNLKQRHPDYFAIADYNNTLICYWDLDYKYSFVNVWDLKTGQQRRNLELGTAHEFRLGKNGKVSVISFQDLVWVLDTETHKLINDDCPDYFIHTIIPNPHCFTACPTQNPFLAIGSTVGRNGEFGVWNYETRTRHFYYQFQDFALITQYPSWKTSEIQDLLNSVSPLLFTPDGKFLVARFKQQKYCMLQIWNLETGNLVQQLENLPALTVHSLAIGSDGQVLACGIRENQVCVWELLSDCIMYTSSGTAPCLMSFNGRILIYCTDNNEIVIWDLALNSQLCTLQGHTAPIGYIAMSNDYEFIASYSIDRSIKIWGLAGD
ncbi:hypothetical protein VB713_14520 [Anabaena cylindrica UHCC 0172]|uniref:WD40 repeat domain-containing protein n=1 Tax=Anabaena cylindrica TaxID=1165 RepID=UPI002B20AF89|nr:hypothetical protein [Anabaena cylindrica]MEA5552156.1 hypothetical protein [Anabaena cylindrica UHCC 0172]